MVLIADKLFPGTVNPIVGHTKEKAVAIFSAADKIVVGILPLGIFADQAEIARPKMGVFSRLPSISLYFSIA